MEDTQIWVLNESSFRANERSCWTRKHVVPSRLRGIRVTPIALLNNDELFMRTRDADFVSFNLLTEKLRARNGLQFEGRIVLGVPFVMSLVWFN